MKEILYLCSVFIKLVYRMDAKKILFIAQEITPYLPGSEIATICRNLPQGIQERLFVFGYSFLFLCNPKPIHICPTAVVSNNGRTSTEHTNLGTDPLSFSCPERSTE